MNKFFPKEGGCRPVRQELAWEEEEDKKETAAAATAVSTNIIQDFHSIIIQDLNL